MDGPRGDHLQCRGWSGGTNYSATDCPGGPTILLRIVRGDQLFCYGWSGGTAFGGTNYSMTGACMCWGGGGGGGGGGAI